MAKPRSGGSVRQGLNVPVQDEATLKWMKNQISVSSSMRHLVHLWIEQYGYRDVFCPPVVEFDDTGEQ